MIIMLLIVWICYLSRSFLFSYCADNPPYCAGSDYYNDPGDALANDPNINVSDILYLNDENQMFYRRVPNTTDCVVENNQIVYIQYPQYCSFNNIGGEALTYKETAFNSNIYLTANGTQGITTSGDCNPEPGQSMTNGVPLLQWSPNPLPA